MNASDIRVGAVLSIDEKVYRILGCSQGIVTLIQLGISKYNFEEINLQYLLTMPDNKVQPTEDIYGAQHVDLTENILDDLKKKAAAIRFILSNIYPDYTILQSKKTVPGLDGFCNTFKCSKPSAHKYIRAYLQTGEDMYSLVDKRTIKMNENRPCFYKTDQSEIVQKQFDEAFKKLKSKELTSATSAYHYIERKYYSEYIYDDGELIRMELKSDRPSERKFRYYLQKRLGNMNLASFKESQRTKRNGHRILFGDAQTGCSHPGAIVEIDACELDIQITSVLDPHQNIGRPVVYFAVDVYSCCIVGYYVGLENNSFMGATSLFNNLFFAADDRVNDDGFKVMPGGFIPDSIRVDHGAEWVSAGLRDLGKECGIDISIAPPAMGSMKGLVENSFHVYQERIRANGHPYGAMYKEFESKHYEKACMQLQHIRKDVENFVIQYNQMLRKGYHLSKDMIRQGVKAVPCELFKYGIENIGTPVMVTEAKKAELIFALCCKCVKDMKCKVDRKGITVKGLHYICTDPDLMNLIEYNHFHKNRQKNYEVRYDPRTVDYVYLELKGRIIKVPLAELRNSNISYQGLTWFEYDLLYREMKAAAKEYEPRSIEKKLLLEEKFDQIAKDASKRKGQVKNIRKNVRDARAIDRELQRSLEALAGNRYETEEKLLTAEEEPVDIPITDNQDTLAETAQRWDDDFQSLDDYFNGKW